MTGDSETGEPSTGGKENEVERKPVRPERRRRAAPLLPRTPLRLWICCVVVTLVFFGVFVWVTMHSAYDYPPADGSSMVLSLLEVLKALIYVMMGLTFGSFIGYLISPRL